MADRVADQLDRWKSDLMDLTRQNRLLYFRHETVSSLEVVAPSLEELAPDLREGSNRRWSLLPSGAQEEAPLSPGAVLVDKPDSAALNKSLVALDRRTNQEFLDKGLHILYLALGMLEWIDDDDKQVNSPVLLVPVSLHRGTPREPFRLTRAEGDVVSNPALAAKLEQYGIEMPEFDPTEPDAQPLVYLDAVQRSISHTQPKWRVARRAVIRTFSFHKEVMYRDLEANKEKVLAHPLVRALAGERDAARDHGVEPVPEDDLDSRVPPERMVSILDADASQRQCIEAARRGGSFVMDGPPGTGKSQTIANMIAELLHAGRSVLFVSEKAAALEVVQSRLAAAGLADYLLELHSNKAGRKEVAKELGRALTSHPRPPSGLAELDRVHAKRQRDSLNEYAAAVNEVRQPLGWSLQRTIGRTAQLHDLPAPPPLHGVTTELSATDLADALEDAQRLSSAWGPVSKGSEFLWRGAKPGVRPQRVLEETAEHIHGVQTISGELAAQLRLSAPEDLWRCRALSELHDHLLAAPVATPPGWLTGADPARVRAVAEAARSRDAELEKVESELSSRALGWQQLNAHDSQRIEEALRQVGATGRGWQPPDFAVAPQLTNMTAILTAAPGVMTSVTAASTRIAAAFGLRDTEFTLQRTLELAELGRLSTSRARPEGYWLRRDVVDRLQHTSRILEELVAASRARREQLREVFTEQVLTLDLPALQHRHATQHQWWRRLGGAYRRDKNQLREVTVGGKVSKEVWESLPAAQDWQGVQWQMTRTQQEQAFDLGPAYWQGEQTDFASLVQALELAKTAVDLLGQQLDQQAAAHQLARTERPDPTLGALGAEIDAVLRPWLAACHEQLGQAEHWMAPLRLEEASSWSSALLEPLRVVDEIAGRVSELVGRAVGLGEVRELLRLRHAAEVARQEHEEHESAVKGALSALYRGLDTDWSAVHGALQWWEGLTRHVSLPVSSDRATVMLNPPNRTDLGNCIDELDKQLHELVDLFEPQYRSGISEELTGHLDDISEVIRALTDTTGDIEEWQVHQQSRTSLNAAGLEPAVTFCLDRAVPAEQVPGICERALLEAWSESVSKQDVRLQTRRAVDRDALVDSFRQLDEQLVEKAAADVMAACNRRRPATTMGAASVILREANKKTRHMPVRKLLDGTRDVAQALKPCFMMSPLTVSQYIPPTLTFDVVIFDEASQVRPADAVNSIYRGAALIVAGDQKQLPPTSFWESSGDISDEYDEDQLEVYDSVLDLGKGTAGLSSLSLRWHYRSQHEALITFSNHSFYDGRLVTFPGATAEADDVGVAFYQVEGVYRRGTSKDNPVEAEEVAERVFYHLRHHRKLSVGVVAFSEAQASLIEQEIDRRRRTDQRDLDDRFTDDRLNGFFVKNLENVQGDERDIMIFSVGYGPDENGKLTMNFGPVNRVGGERRLNVAITRARRRVEVVASLNAADITGGTNGVPHLRRYLDYAERGQAALALDLTDSLGDVESPFEEEVLRVVRGWGYDVVPQVGASGYRIDLGVRHPDKPGSYLLGVECDGFSYHSSKVARDRDRLREQVLNGLGWQLHRIWSTGWFLDRRQEEERLRRALEEARNARGAGRMRGGAVPRHSQPVEVVYDDVDVNKPPKWTEPYVEARLTAHTRELPMTDPLARPELVRLLVEVVSVEGPVLPDVVLARVRQAWGVGRTGSQIRAAFADALRDASAKARVREAPDGSLLSPQRGLASVRVPDGQGNGRRAVKEVPDDEIALAVRLLIGDVRRIEGSELVVSVARVFGWERTSAGIGGRIEAAVERLVAGRQVVRDGATLVPAD